MYPCCRILAMVEIPISSTITSFKISCRSSLKSGFSMKFRGSNFGGIPSTAELSLLIKVPIVDGENSKFGAGVCKNEREYSLGVGRE